MRRRLRVVNSEGIDDEFVRSHVQHTGHERLKPYPVPDEIIDKVLYAAVRAPSPNNVQLWNFIVIKDVETRRRVGAIYSKAGHAVKDRNRILRDNAVELLRINI